MENEMRLVSRKERRRLAEQQRRKVQVRRGAALLGTTLTACSLVTPMVPATIQAEAATETRAATNTSAFIAEIASHAQPVASANDLYASVMIAQAVVESAWGTSTLSKAPYYNLFGIKGSYQGNSVSMNTQEYLNGKWVTMKEPFRDYPSYQQAFEDNAYVLRNVYMGGQYYYRGAWKSNCSSYRDATAWLTGRYATAPHYAAALNSVIATYNLTRYDTPASGSAGGGASTGSSNSGSNSGGVNNGGTSTGTTSQTYTVKSGDSVWLIANKYGISMNQLIQWNNIKNNFIYPGQKLIVSKSAAGSSNSGSTSSSNSAGNSGSSSSNNTSSNTSGNSSYYTVKSGDSVWLIANKYGISMNQLIQWNGIKNNLIHPGQKLIVSKTGSSSSNNNTSSNSSSSSNAGSSTNTSSNNNTSANTNTSGKYYTVKSGDSVWLIAHNNGITMNQLIQWNNIKNNFIYPGQKLLVSQSGNTTNTNQSNGATNNTSASSSTKTYKAVSGDSLWGIAQKYNMSVSQLKQLNNLTSDMIYIGQTLKVK